MSEVLLKFPPLRNSGLYIAGVPVRVWDWIIANVENPKWVRHDGSIFRNTNMVDVVSGIYLSEPDATYIKIRFEL